MSADENSLKLCQVVLDSTEPRELAEFYRVLLGLVYRPGDEPPEGGEGGEGGEGDEAGRDWLVLRTAEGAPCMAFQHVDRLAAPTWPEGAVPQQMHLDLSVSSVEDLQAQHERVLAFHGRLLSDHAEGPGEPFRVYADPSGHPFCIFVS
ncbi:VOC family protein [Streptomyces sp. NPDC059698]|uniref:VOC family protein n=1 Tax=unclassified Streptomyces TaxID=2593676 RepID=UPI00093D2896|nr:glyoxalase [Streptomyces sp. CB02366]